MLIFLKVIDNEVKIDNYRPKKNISKSNDQINGQQNEKTEKPITTKKYGVIIK